MCMHTIKYVIKSCLTCEIQEKLVLLAIYELVWTDEAKDPFTVLSTYETY